MHCDSAIQVERVLNRTVRNFSQADLGRKYLDECGVIMAGHESRTIALRPHNEAR
ncbi:hypothetical protein [Paraburkholderia fynbosensis]|uniref:Uncharacterized protein n=1 Tax=Paraburkholderia fynbosensis TaxID=1200993 RepID=A0A6J5FDS6_9BURK|nr:hypothetical protein [Paraburkholderia fynbosensis]CAB3778141.1 hypothetical protein LMG27177_00538 [Paraburkholderia fynbosensis]